MKVKEAKKRIELINSIYAEVWENENLNEEYKCLCNDIRSSLYDYKKILEKAIEEAEIGID